MIVMSSQAHKMHALYADRANEKIRHQPILRTGSSSLAGARPTHSSYWPDDRRLAEEIALHLIAALDREETELVQRFDAFGDNGDVKTVTETDHRPDNRGRLGVAAEIHHERAVDLDLVEREGLQIGQR